MTRLALEVLGGEIAIVRLAADEGLPAWFKWKISPIASVTRTNDEVSIVYPDTSVPPGVQAERGWRIIKVNGPLSFSLTGILHSILSPLAAAAISVFTLSTYDTDYVLVRRADLPRALKVLSVDFDITSIAEQ